MKWMPSFLRISRLQHQNLSKLWLNVRDVILMSFLLSVCCYGFMGVYHIAGNFGEVFRFGEFGIDR